MIKTIYNAYIWDVQEDLREMGIEGWRRKGQERMEKESSG
jgi:hypothetical protein